MVKKLKSFLLYQFPALAWAALIFTLSSLPPRKLPHFPFGFDKVLHGGVFFVLCWLSHRAFRFQGIRFLSGRSLVFAVLATMVYGATDEFHQIYVPGRTADINDLIADTIGGCCYVLIIAVIQAYQTEYRRS